MEPRPPRVRAALRAFHTAFPTEAALVEAHLDALAQRCVQLSAEDPYRALVLDLHETMVQVNSGVLADIARVEVERLEVAKADALQRAAEAAERVEARNVWKALATPQVAITLITLLLGSGGLGGMIVQHFFPVAVGAAP